MKLLILSFVIVLFVFVSLYIYAVKQDKKRIEELFK